MVKKAYISWRLKIKQKIRAPVKRHIKIKAIVVELKYLKDDPNFKFLNRSNIYHNKAFVNESESILYKSKQWALLKDLGMIPVLFSKATKQSFWGINRRSDE